MIRSKKWLTLQTSLHTLKLTSHRHIFCVHETLKQQNGLTWFGRKPEDAAVEILQVMVLKRVVSQPVLRSRSAAVLSASLFCHCHRFLCQSFTGIKRTLSRVHWCAKFLIISQLLSSPHLLARWPCYHQQTVNPEGQPSMSMSSFCQQPRLHCSTDKN